MALFTILPDWKTAKAALCNHYAAPQREIFKQYRAGATLFGVGLMTVLMALLYMSPSTQQELAVLAGIILVAIGFLIAMSAYIRLVISRFIHFFKRP